MAFALLNGTKSVSRKVERSLKNADYSKAYELAVKKEKIVVANESVVAYYASELCEKEKIKDKKLESAWIDRGKKRFVIQINDKYYLYAVENDFAGYKYVDCFSGSIEDETTTNDEKELSTDIDKIFRQLSEKVIKNEIKSCLNEEFELPKDSISRINKLLRQNKLTKKNGIEMVGNN